MGQMLNDIGLLSVAVVVLVMLVVRIRIAVVVGVRVVTRSAVNDRPHHGGACGVCDTS
jgi:hypothetical protein